MRKTLVGTATAIMLTTSFTGTALGATHEVKPGDSLWKIASKYQTSVSQLKDWNHLKSDLIYPKQVIIVTPDEAKKPQTQKPKANSTNGNKQAAPSTSAKTYVVVSGDSLFNIAIKHNISLADLVAWNGLKGDLIHPGQVLKVSNSSATVKPNGSSNESSNQTSQKTDTYKVVSGDTLSGIAARYGTTVSKLKSQNGLNSDLIRVGQVLKVSNSTTTKPAETVKPNESKNTSSNNSSQNTSTYKVVSGDTLSGIAARYGTTVSKLKSLNGLSSDFLQVGQVLKVNASSSATPEKSQTKPSQGKNTNTGSSSKTEATNAAKLISTAKGVLGSPYAWGGTSPSGFDCSGFIYYAFSQSGHNVPRTSSEGYYDRSYYVKDPQPGDLVFFRDTYKPGISHMGIYLGNGDFIHANDKGVNIINLSNPYWKSKFDGYKRFY
ncbi:D-gamma-glutamyl-meso-diaminopimelic acid endopeptidase CwlS [Lederbergia ruris]|uniref:D-gamma-glutamyl-meso-diaminopimelic acid endopeptidase CwlS n=1 Tax=Lederbergia ruris TaxID=217495 RepID=A0ABQ4KIR4_9BACI|nr:peptidoglycan endopeptidase [Lederbergia ruris]GIN57238.1 D-gamma-glutamyl-meso-diaminopimelic acid endopeptidase CwlS [Lederbergia ruris]